MVATAKLAAAKGSSLMQPPQTAPTALSSDVAARFAMDLILDADRRIVELLILALGSAADALVGPTPPADVHAFKNRLHKHLKTDRNFWRTVMAGAVRSIEGEHARLFWSVLDTGNFPKGWERLPRPVTTDLAVARVLRERGICRCEGGAVQGTCSGPPEPSVRTSGAHTKRVVGAMLPHQRHVIELLDSSAVVITPSAVVITPKAPEEKQ